MFHGNGGAAADRGFYVDALGARRYRVILAEYPRYGGRKGELGERAFVVDGIETIRLAFEEYGSPLYILGESLGCGVAAGRDEIIPIRHAENLFNSLPGTSKKMWTIEGAGHNDWYTYTNSSWWEEIMSFVSGNEKNEQ